MATISLNRVNEFEGRSYPFEIDADQIESVWEIDRRGGVNVIVRTKTGIEFACANGYDDVKRRWKDAARE